MDRVHAGELGLTQKDVVDNVITALNSNYMIAPNYWVDRKSGNDYYLTVQYFEHGMAAIHNMADLGQIPLRDPSSGAGMSCGPAGSPPPHPGGAISSWACAGAGAPTTVLKNVVDVKQVMTPTEVDHYQIQRAVDIFVTPKGEDLGKVTDAIRGILARGKKHSLKRARELAWDGAGNGGVVQEFRVWISDFFHVAVSNSDGAIQIVYRSVPDHAGNSHGICRRADHSAATRATLNVMSLMGVLMLVGIADSNSILIVDFAHNLEKQGLSPADAVITACRVRLRPILMTSLATIIGMIPMALKMGTGAEQYAPMAKAIIGGLTSSVLLTIFIVPAAYLLVYGGKQNSQPAPAQITEPMA